jgi:hypothetical protein
VPLEHTSPTVQALPSLHAEPLGLTGSEQTPVLGLHTPTLWHESLAVQTTAAEPRQ